MSTQNNSLWAKCSSAEPEFAGEAEAIGELGLAAEWRWELKTYRAARKQRIHDEQAWGGSSAVARQEALGKRPSDQR
jgi:hypothetical protein